MPKQSLIQDYWKAGEFNAPTVQLVLEDAVIPAKRLSVSPIT